jgi:hypothetical protein
VSKINHGMRDDKQQMALNSGRNIFQANWHVYSWIRGLCRRLASTWVAVEVPEDDALLVRAIHHHVEHLGRQEADSPQHDIP